MERAEEEEREKVGSKKRTVRKEEGGVIGGTDKSKEWAEAVDRQVDLLDLLVNGPSTRTHLVQTCAHTHTDLQHLVGVMSRERLVMLLNDAGAV